MAQIEFRSPGVFGIEKTPATAPDSLSPAVAGFIGWTDEGPVNTPIKVRSIEEFNSRFGQITSLGVIPISMRAFFGTGGQETWIVRVVPADALKASADVETGNPDPGPTSSDGWVFEAIGEGTWGNTLDILVRGNRNFLNRTTGEWDRFDVLVRRPSDFNPDISIAAEVYEAVQFTDPNGDDYILDVITDVRAPSQLITLTENAGGTPSALFGSDITDEAIGSGTGVSLDDYTGTLASPPVLDSTLRIVAEGSTIDDEAQTPTPAPDDAATSFTMTLPNAPVLDDSVRLFAGGQSVLLEGAPFAGAVDGANTDFTLSAGGLSDKIHREASVFQLWLPNVDANSGVGGNHGSTDGSGSFDLAANAVPVTTGGQPVHPGTVVVTFTTSTDTMVDNGDGTVSGTGGLAGVTGFIDYLTGTMWTDASFSTPLVVTGQAATDPVTTDFDVSTFLEKSASADNLATGVSLVGGAAFPATLDAGGANPNTVDLVDSVATPTGNGPISFSVDAGSEPDTWGPGALLVDFVPLLVVDDDADGDLTGDTAAGTNTVDHTTGAIDVTFDQAPATGLTIDADYMTGQVATDDGLGNLIGDVDSSGNNTIDYETGAFDVVFASTVAVGTNNILANYRSLPSENVYPLSSGTDGTSVGRSDISDPALEDDRKGIYALDSIEEPINVVVPDFEGSSDVQADLVDFAENRNQGPGTRFAILGAANGTTIDELIKYVLVDQVFDSRAAAFYYPNVKFVNEINNSVETLPVTPFVAGVYAKTARNKNVGKSPGGIEDGALDAPGTVGPELDLNLADRDRLYSSRINPVFESAATGFVVWGVRTLSNDKRWRYVNARLLHNFLMHRTFLLLQFAVFENNGPALWLRIEQALKGFLDSLFRLGFFAGSTADEAFFVKANSSNNNAQTIDEGKVIIDVGFSPSKPAEFVIFRLAQPAGTQVS